MAAEVPPLLITGGTGRIGTVLHDFWPWAMKGGLRPIWQARHAAPGFLGWDILNEPAPPWAGGIVLHLAGGRADPGAEVPLARAILAAAQAQGARHVFLASSAAVYPAGSDLTEDTPPAPASPYGQAKRAMEDVALDWHARHGLGLTILRIGNVAGADALLGSAGGAVVTLDPIPGGTLGPLRSYIGPITLSAVLARLAALAAARTALPPILNIAAPRPVAMGALLDAAGIPWSFGPTPAPRPAVTLDTTRLQSLVRLPPNASQPRAIVAEWRNVTGP